MRVFVTGASGWIGSAVVPELVAAGHEVVGLARSDAAAETVHRAGATVVHGAIGDLDVLARAAADSEGVIHLAFIHDFSNFADSIQADRAAIAAIGSSLEGTERPLVIASGFLGLNPGTDTTATESDMPDPSSPRAAAAAETLAMAERGVRSAVLRLPPSVHGKGDKGFVPTLINVARQRGTAAYVGDGRNRWGSVHRNDAARLFRLAVESAPAGSVLHAVGDEGVPARTLAETFARHLSVPATSVAPEQAAEHFGWIGAFFAMNGAASATATRKLLGWEPTEVGLVEDLDQGHYFEG